MVKIIKINGKEYQASFNANRELSKSVEGLDDSVLINWTRERNCNNGIPVIKDDTGTEFRLGWHFMTQAEKDTQKEYKGGLNTGTKPAAKKTPVVPLAVAKEVLAQKGLSKETRDFFEAVVKEAEESAAKNIEAAVKALMNLGMSEEKARELAKLQN